jgi:uncharacterized protein involved in exopolysaccharide biosynthesis
VQKMDRQIAEAEASLESLTKAAKAPEGDEGQAKRPAGGVQGDASLAQLNSQLEVNRLEIANLTEDEKKLKSQTAEYQSRLNLTPVREQQLTDVLTNYELAKQNYADLLNKKTQSELATSLEVHQQGQQFRIIDPPSIPRKPTSPNRIKISLGGTAAGLFLGVVLAFLVEAEDHSLHDEKDASGQFDVPLVVGVPLLFSQAEERRRPWKRRLEWIAGSVLVMAVALAQYYIYQRG